MVRRGEPLSRIERDQPEGGLLIGALRVPRALPGRHRPSRRDLGDVRRWLSFDLGDRPGEPGELAGGGDRDDRAAFGAFLQPAPGAVQALLG